jgi:Flp pilus assembly protein TadD
MNQPLRTSSAASLVVLATMIAGCAAPQSHFGAASSVSKVDPNAALGTRALAALNSNNAPLAIELAEKAVAKTPQDDTVRALLGNAYFAGGRFRSAETAFKDAQTINPNQPQVVLKLALVQIAQGKNSEAVALLNSARSILDTSDYGLALALAGRSEQAIAVLEPAARQVGADATVRQNLALAYAFAGNWDEARLVASQDVPGNQLDARIQQWMQLAKPQHASDQVAALVGVTPAGVDAGEPVQLALNKSDTQQAQAKIAAPYKSAEAAPAAAAAASVSAAAPAAVSLAPVAPVAPPKEVVASMPAPATPPAVVAVAPAPPPPTSTLATFAASAVSQAKAVLASVLPHNPKPVAKPHRVTAAIRPETRRGNSQVVVQLGAYGSPERVLAGWDRQARKFGALKAYLPMSARFASPKGVFYRLSVRGFASVSEADGFCNALRHEGGKCFVRNFAGDRPVEYASR